MRVVNAAKHASAEVTVSLDAEARTSLLVVCKATYRIPANDRVPRPCLPPPPLTFTDVFSGEPGLSAPLLESEMTAPKPACDVVFKASAHSPDGEPHTVLDVAARVGSMSKAVRVWGDRVWEKDLFILRAGRPKPFTSMPLHYGRAFGGYHVREGTSDAVYDAYAPNPFGTGYAQHADAPVHGLPMPNLEASGFPIRSPRQGRAVALSPLPRNVPLRARYAGTYDEHWREHYAPFLPPDFDVRFLHCVPEDQRIPYPAGGEEVVLLHMMPGRPEVRFRLPRLDTIPVRVLHRDYRVSVPVAHVDTLTFEPDEARFSVIWRAMVPLGLRGAREVRLVAVGQVCDRWWEGIRRGGTGCVGCGEHEVVFADSPSGNSTLANSIPADPEHCPDSPDMPAKDPLMPLPEVMFVGADPAEQAPETESAKGTAS